MAMKIGLNAKYSLECTHWQRERSSMEIMRDRFLFGGVFRKGNYILSLIRLIMTSSYLSEIT